MPSNKSKNEWNNFQSLMKDKGLSKEQVSKLYKTKSFKRQLENSNNKSPLISVKSRKQFRNKRPKAKLYVQLNAPIELDKPEETIGYIVTKGPLKGTFYSFATNTTITTNRKSKRSKDAIKLVGQMKWEDLQKNSKPILVKENSKIISEKKLSK